MKIDILDMVLAVRNNKITLREELFLAVYQQNKPA